MFLITSITDKLFEMNTNIRVLYVWFCYFDMATCMFCQWFMAINMIFTSRFNYWTEDAVYQLKSKSKNIKAIFPASGGRAKMIVRDAFKSRGFLLILYRERQILKLIKFWLSLLLTRANG